MDTPVSRDPLDVKIDEKYREIASLLKASASRETMNAAFAELRAMQRKRAEDLTLDGAGGLDALEKAKQILREHGRLPPSIPSAGSEPTEGTNKKAP